MTIAVIEQDVPMYTHLPVIIASVLFLYAEKVAQVLICLHGHFMRSESSCKSESQSEGAFIAIGFVALLTIIFILRDSNKGAQTTHKVIAVSIVMIGALVSILHIAITDEGFATQSLAVPLTIWCTVVAFFITIYVYLPSPEMVRTVMLRALIATIIGFVAGLLLQLLVVVSHFWGSDGNQDMEIAPSAIAGLMACWAITMLDPFLRPGKWAEQNRSPYIWTGLLFVLAVIICSLYGWLQYAPGRAKNLRIAVQAEDIRHFVLAGLFVSVFLSSLVACLVAVITSSRERMFSHAAMLTVVFSGSATWAMALAVKSGPLEQAFLVIVQLGSGLLMVSAVYLTHRFESDITRFFQRFARHTGR